MRNTILIGIIVIALGYMVSIMFDKYENMKTTNAIINKNK